MVKRKKRVRETGRKRERERERLNYELSENTCKMSQFPDTNFN